MPPILCLAAEGYQQPLVKPLLAGGSGHQKAGRQLRRSHLILGKCQVEASEIGSVCPLWSRCIHGAWGKQEAATPAGKSEGSYLFAVVCTAPGC